MYDKKELQEIADKSKSKSEFCRLLGFKENGRSFLKLNKIIIENNLDVKHFDPWHHSRLHKKIEKTCPVCKKHFTTKSGAKNEKKTCSISCSNSYFRSGTNNGMYKKGLQNVKIIQNSDGRKIKIRKEYRIICFNHWEYKCAICDWDKVLEVHHIDFNNSNNDKKNLIPLCPNCHKMTEVEYYKNEINCKIEKLLQEKWKN